MRKRAKSNAPCPYPTGRATWEGWGGEDCKARSDRQEVRNAQKTGKPYTWFRVPNDDIFSQVNTLQKMAQKRAMVGAVLIATRASGFLTQDMEDTQEVSDVPPPPQNRAMRRL